MCLITGWKLLEDLEAKADYGSLTYTLPSRPATTGPKRLSGVPAKRQIENGQRVTFCVW